MPFYATIDRLMHRDSFIKFYLNGSNLRDRSMKVKNDDILTCQSLVSE